MKSVPSLLWVRLVSGALFILVFLMNRLSVAQGIMTPVLTDNQNQINLGVDLKEKFVMPVADDIVIDNSGYKSRVYGTDKWNDLIYKVSEEENIDPVFVKCIMALESAGEGDLVHYNKNGTFDSGLMQVNSSWASSFDLWRLTNDPEYAIRCGIAVIKAKISACEKNGHEPTIHEVAWRYNGYCEQGRKYADRFSLLYTDLSKNTSDISIFMKVEEPNTSEYNKKA